HVGNASFQLTKTYDEYTLNAFVYNNINGAMYVEIIVLDSLSNQISNIMSKVSDNAYFPDIIIRDDSAYLDSKWYVTIIYNKHLCPNNEIYITEFNIENPNNLSIIGNNSFLVGDGIFPKIDGFVSESLIVKNQYF